MTSQSIIPIYGHWHIEDSDDGWYVVRPYGNGRCGPFTEDEASRQLPLLRETYGVSPSQESHI